MAEDTTALFIEIAVEKGYLTAEQVAECQRAVAAASQAGLKVTLLKAVQDRNPLSVKQAADIRRETARRGVPPRIGGYELIEKLGAGRMRHGSEERRRVS